jgi:hypothetical protein
MPYKDRFGYVPWAESITWTGGKIEPIAEFEKVIESVKAETGSDEYLYPAGPREFMHKLPLSHSIELNGTSGDQEQLRKGIAGFTIHFVGFLSGHRCQFEDWWVDGCVSIKSQADFSFGVVIDIGPCIEQAIKTWSGWTEPMQRTAINALFLHNRTHTYHWDWERFQSTYAVLDALYRLANTFYGVNAIGHADRINALCSSFSLSQDNAYVLRIVDLRNNLIHEGLWDGGMPGEARSDDAFMAAFDLRRLCSRLFFAVFAIEADYIHSPRRSRGQFLLKPRHP